MKKRQLALMPLLIAITLLAVPAAHATSPVEANISVEAGEFTVGDPIQLTLSVTHPDDHTVIVPELDENWGKLTIRAQSPASTVSNGDGTETTRQMIDVRLFAPGAYTTPPLAITVSDGQGVLTEVLAAPINLSVASVLIEGDTELRDIKPQIELPYSNLLPWVIGGIGATTIGAAIAYLWWRRRQARLALATVDNRPPHQVAMDELARIAELGLPEQGKFKAHYTLVSDCIRTYMERAYGIPVVERTTGEVQASMRQTDVAQDVTRVFISFLDESDLVKFSTFRPDTASAYRLLAHGREIIESTKPAVVADQIENGQTDTKTDNAPKGTDYPTRRAHAQSEVTL